VARAETVPIIVQRWSKTADAGPAQARSVGALPASSPALPRSADTVIGTSATEPCHSSSFELAPVMHACQAGGRQAARDLMELAVQRAQVKGVVLTCLGCHADEAAYEHGPNAVADLRPWL
jgi:hypothetical protein